MTVKISEMTVTWNEGSTVFSAIKMNVTDTASAAGSKLLDLQVGGADIFAVTKDRTAFLYNTYTDASNYERGFMSWNSNVLEISTEAAGTGTIRTLQVGNSTAGLTLPLGDGTVAKAILEARDGIFFRTRGVARLFLNESGVAHADFYPTSDGTVALGRPTSNLGWTQVAFREVSTDPVDPDEGQSVLWQSDGTGTGDDGDIMMKITAGGVTKTVTLVDFSAV